MAVKWKTQKGNVITLLNPAEKGKKYAKELREGKKYTNDGVLKKDENGNSIQLTKEDRQYRVGYLNSRKDGAGVYDAQKKKKAGSRKGGK